jgi:predicted secreted protein
MAKFVATDYTVTVGGVNLTDHVAQVDMPIDVDEVETTAFGGSGWRDRLGGLKSGSVTLSFHQDFAASSVDQTLWPLLGTTTTVVVKPTNGAVSSTNPSYSGTFVVTSLTPINGSVGDLATQDVTWPSAGPITRLTS